MAAQLAHTPLDAVYLTEATTLEELLAYPVLIYPHGEILTSQRAQLLEAYVRAGGTLVLGARTGQKDAHGQCVMQPMPGLLADLTQTAVKEFTLLGPGDDPVTMEWEGHLLPTGVFNDVLEGMEAPSPGSWWMPCWSTPVSGNPLRNWPRSRRPAKLPCAGKREKNTCLYSTIAKSPKSWY